MKRLLGVWAVLVGGIALAIAGCEVGPNYQTPTVPTPAKYSEAEARPTTQPAQAVAAPPTDDQLKRWWETFRDPELNRLIERAMGANLSVEDAAERIAEARYQEYQTDAGFYPNVGAVGAYSHARRSGHLGGGSGFSGAVLESDEYQLGLTSAWQIDLFGGIRRGVEAARANAEAAEEDRREVLITLLGDVATDYVTLRGLQGQVAITQQNVVTQEQTLNLIQTQNRAGLVADLAVAQQNAQLLTTQSTLPDLESAIHVQIHALSVLMDLPPGALEAELESPAPIPFGPAHVPAGLPSDLLRRRPDIRQAERLVAAASAEIGVATAQLYPQISLTGSLGYESGELSQLLDLHSRYFSFGPTVTWPIFNTGQILYGVHVETSLERQALLNYQLTILTGLQEVDDSLITFAREQDRMVELQNAVVADERAVELTQTLYRDGLDTFLDVLTTQNTLLLAQESLVGSEQAVSTDLVTLYIALGGGWETAR